MENNKPIFFESSKITSLCPFNLHNITVCLDKTSYDGLKKYVETLLQSVYNVSLCKGSECEHWTTLKDDPRFGSCNKYE